MAILELQVSVRDQNRSEFDQEHTWDNTQVKRDKMDVHFSREKRLKNIFFPIFWGFDDSVQYWYGKGINNT